MVTASLRFRAQIISVALLIAFIGVWHLSTRSTAAVANMSPAYARLMGITATQGKSAMPGPADVGARLWEHLKRPFYDAGPNDKGLGIQLGYSIARVNAAKEFGEVAMNSRLAAKEQQGWPSQISFDSMCMKPTPS